MIPPLNIIGLQKSSRKIIYPHTRMGMVFYPCDDPDFKSVYGTSRKTSSPISVVWDAKKTQGALISFDGSKRGGQPAGTWTATIKDPPRYFLSVAAGDIIPGDWVDIFVVRNGVMIPYMRGRVEDLRVDEHSEGGATVRTWQIAGRDHGGLSEFPISYTNLWARDLDQLVSGFMTRRVNFEIGGNPSKLFETLLEACWAPGKNYSSWTIPPSLVNAIQAKVKAANIASVGTTTEYSADKDYGILDILQVKNTTPTRGGYFNEPLMWTQAGGTAYDLINQWCHPLLNEMYFDIEVKGAYAAGKSTDFDITAVIRERPFVLSESRLEYYASRLSAVTGIDFSGDIKTGLDSPWFSLKLHKLPQWIVQAQNFGYSDHERLNLFQLLSDMSFGSNETEQVAMSPPSYHRDSIRRHGLRFFQQTTKYAADTSRGKGLSEWYKAKQDWQRVLRDWYCLNPYFRQGSATFKLALPEIRFGQRVQIDTGQVAQNFTYYVEGADLSWRAGGGGTEPPTSSTNVLLTRGFKGTDSDLVKAVTEVSGRYEDMK